MDCASNFERGSRDRGSTSKEADRESSISAKVAARSVRAFLRHLNATTKVFRVRHDFLHAQAKCGGCLSAVIRGDFTDLTCGECGTIVRTIPSDQIEDTRRAIVSPRLVLRLTLTRLRTRRVTTSSFNASEKVLYGEMTDAVTAQSRNFRETGPARLSIR